MSETVTGLAGVEVADKATGVPETTRREPLLQTEALRSATVHGAKNSWSIATDAEGANQMSKSRKAGSCPPALDPCT